MAQAGPLSYTVRLDTSVGVKCHVDHVRFQGPGQPVKMEETEGSRAIWRGRGDIILPATCQARGSCPREANRTEIVDEGAEETPVVQDENVAQRPELRRSS